MTDLFDSCVPLFLPECLRGHWLQRGYIKSNLQLLFVPIKKGGFSVKRYSLEDKFFVGIENATSRDW